MSWVYLCVTHAYAAPLTSILAVRDGGGSSTASDGVTDALGLPHFAQSGESAEARTIYTVLSLTCMLLLAAMLGSRAKYLRLDHLSSMNFIRVNVVVLYLLAIAFVISSAVIETGLGLGTAYLCRSAILMCLVYYVSGKVAMYIFLIERAHSLRAPYLRRCRDWLWLASMLSILIGFGILAVFAFMKPVVDFTERDKKCRIGLPRRTTMVLLTYDTLVNLSLTGVFIYLLRPLLRFGTPSGQPYWGSRARTLVRRLVGVSPHSAHEMENGYILNTGRLQAVEKLVWKSLIGAFVVLLPTIGNLVVLFHMGGRELGWLCLTICTLDVTLGVCVVHWLTVDPPEMERRTATPTAGTPLSATGAPRSAATTESAGSEVIAL